MKIEPDQWLTGILKSNVFKVTLSPGETAGDISAIFAEAGAGRAFYYVKISAVSVEQVGMLTTVGFRVVDVNMTFERGPGGSSGSSNPSIIVREADSADESAVLDIAASCFVYSRFHLDPRIPKATADTIKREWVANYFKRQRGDRLLVAELDGKPVGFLAEIAANVYGKSARVIDLIGVGKSFQRRGVGSSLIRCFIDSHAGTDRVLRVGTQAANTPSMQIYERMGFSIVDAQYVLHAHLMDGKIL